MDASIHHTGFAMRHTGIGRPEGLQVTQSSTQEEASIYVLALWSRLLVGGCLSIFRLKDFELIETHADVPTSWYFRQFEL